jgi:hypothetical protein
MQDDLNKLLGELGYQLQLRDLATWRTKKSVEDVLIDQDVHIFFMLEARIINWTMIFVT